MLMFLLQIVRDKIFKIVIIFKEAFHQQSELETLNWRVSQI